MRDNIKQKLRFIYFMLKPGRRYKVVIIPDKRVIVSDDCMFIQTSPKGYNFLNMKTGKVIFTKALSPDFRNPISSNGYVRIRFAQPLHMDVDRLQIKNIEEQPLLIETGEEFDGFVNIQIVR